MPERLIDAVDRIGAGLGCVRNATKERTHSLGGQFEKEICSDAFLTVLPFINYKLQTKLSLTTFCKYPNIPAYLIFHYKTVSQERWASISTVFNFSCVKSIDKIIVFKNQMIYDWLYCITI